MTKYNHMLDVAFTVISEHENDQDIPIQDILSALKNRIKDLEQSETDNSGSIRESFGYSDTYEMEED